MSVLEGKFQALRAHSRPEGGHPRPERAHPRPERAHPRFEKAYFRFGKDHPEQKTVLLKPNRTLLRYAKTPLEPMQGPLDKQTTQVHRPGPVLLQKQHRSL